MPIVLDEQPDPTKVKPLIETSAYRSYKAYVDAGIPDIEIPRDVSAPYKAQQDFFSKVDKSKGPIKRIIKRMLRRREKGIEYLTYTEDWEAKDWLDRDIEGVTDKLEGIVYLPNMKVAIDEKGQRIGKEPKGQITKYEIPYKKETVEQLISETGTPRDDIIFTFRTPDRRSNCVVYDQFINNTFQQGVEIMMQDGHFETDHVESLKKRDTSQQSKPKS